MSALSYPWFHWAQQVSANWWKNNISIGISNTNIFKVQFYRVLDFMRNEISPEIRWLEMIARENINETEISSLCDAEDNEHTKREVEALILSFSTPSCISITIISWVSVKKIHFSFILLIIRNISKRISSFPLQFEVSWVLLRSSSSLFIRSWSSRRVEPEVFVLVVSVEQVDVFHNMSWRPRILNIVVNVSFNFK